MQFYAYIYYCLVITYLNKKAYLNGQCTVMPIILYEHVNNDKYDRIFYKFFRCYVILTFCLTGKYPFYYVLNKWLIKYRNLPFHIAYCFFKKRSKILSRICFYLCYTGLLCFSISTGYVWATWYSCPYSDHWTNTIFTKQISTQ